MQFNQEEVVCVFYYASTLKTDQCKFVQGSMVKKLFRESILRHSASIKVTPLYSFAWSIARQSQIKFIAPGRGRDLLMRETVPT